MTQPIVQVIVQDPKLHEYEVLAKGSMDAAGYDLRACIDEPLIVQPGQAALVSTGLSIYIADPSICCTLLPRSGLGHKHGIVLGNLVGLIDADYQGPLMMSLWNRSGVPYEVKPYERMAQAVFLPVIHPQFQHVDHFVTPTQRGGDGFNSTGTK